MQEKINISVNFAIYTLFLLLPVCFITGPFLTDLFLSLIGIFFLYLVISKRLFKDYFKNKYVLLFFLFYTIISISSLLSYDIYSSLRSSLFYFRFLFFTIAIWYILKNYYYSIEYFCIIFLLVYLFIIFDGFYQYFFNYDIFGFEKPLVDRLSGPFDDELILGSVLSRFFPFAVFCIIIINHKSSYKFTYLYAVFLILVLSIVILSGERTSLFFLIFSQIILLTTLKKINLKSLTLIFILISATFFTAIFFDKDIRHRLINTTYNQIFAFSDNNNEKYICSNEPEKCERKLKIFSVNHQGHYLTGYKMFKDKPFLGHGPRMFRYMCDQKKFKTYAGCSTHPHNVYIQLAAETGILGLIIPFFLLICVSYILLKEFYLKNIKKSYNMNDLTLTLLVSILISLFPFAPSGNIFNNYMSFIYYLPVGFILYIIHENRRFNEF